MALTVSPSMGSIDGSLSASPQGPNEGTIGESFFTCCTPAPSTAM
jgi:hypothetical protein